MTPTPALLGDQSHSFLDNTIALFGHIRAWDCSPESRRYGRQPKAAGWLTITDRDRPRQHERSFDARLFRKAGHL